MKRNNYILDIFNAEQLRKEKLTYSEAVKIFEMLFSETLSLRKGIFKNKLEGIEVEIRVAKILNSLK